MEFKYRAVDEPPPPPPSYRHQTAPSFSGYGYFTEQAIRAGYGIPGPGRAYEYFNRGHGGANGYLRNHFDIRETFQREQGKERIREEIIAAEIARRQALEAEVRREKERIREEIIAAEIARRQALEAEVRREMMIERELALRARGGGGVGSAFDRFSFLLGSAMGFQAREVPFQQNKERSLEERIAMSLEERLQMGLKCENWGFEMVPFQGGSVEPKNKEVTITPSDLRKEKNKIVILAKPDASLSGAKRKAVSPEEENASERLSNGIAKKKVKEEWSCALCQVSATSEHGLNDHIRGKRHKSKETALRAQRNGTNIGIGVFPKKVIKPSAEVTHNLSSVPGLKSKGELLQPKQSGESSLKIKLKINPSAESSKENNISMLQESDKTDNLGKKKLAGAQKAPKKGEKEKKSFTFWCEMCQVGTYNGNVMEEHRKGKKHMARLQEAKENGKAIPTPQFVAIQGVDNADEATKEGDRENVEDVDGAVRLGARRDADGLGC